MTHSRVIDIEGGSTDRVSNLGSAQLQIDAVAYHYSMLVLNRSTIEAGDILASAHHVIGFFEIDARSIFG